MADLPENVSFSVWERKETDGKMKSILTKKELRKEEYIDMIKKHIQSFRQHLHRISEQYKQIKELKEKLPENHVIVHMDFAENFLCQSVEAPQGAGYFNATYVSLHPTVIYYRTDSGIDKDSAIYVSEDLTHSAVSVRTIMNKVVENVKQLLPNAACIHYLTDSPSSQYRNRTIAYLISHHVTLFGIQGAWIYFEAGHGKGACDGVGGSSKRMADEAVKHEKVVIQNAQDYYEWGKETSSLTKYFFYSSKEVEKSRVEIASMTTTPIKGIMKSHAMICPEAGTLFVRETSCYCDLCFRNGIFVPHCNGWIKHVVPITEEEESSDESGSNSSSNEGDNESAGDMDSQDGAGVCRTSDDTECSDEDESLRASPDYTLHEYVVSKYEGKWYLGKIVRIEQDVLVRFMEHTKYKGRFVWPEVRDELWICPDDILMQVPRPTKLSKFSKAYRITKSCLEKIEALDNKD